MSTQKKKDNSLNKLAFYNMLAPILLNGISFFTMPVFTRILGTEQLGIFTVFLSWLSITSIVLSLQIHASTSIAFINYKDKTDEYFSSILCIPFILFFILTIPAIVFIEPIARFIHISQPAVILLLLGALGFACVTFTQSIYTFTKQGKKNFYLSVSVSLAGIVLSLILINTLSNYFDLYFLRITGHVIPYIIIGIPLAGSFFFKGKTFFNKEYWKFCLAISIPIVFHGLSHILLNQTDKIMLQRITDDSTVGIYGFAVIFAQIIHIIYTAFNSTWVPFYYDDMSENNSSSIYKRQKNYMFVFTCISLGFLLLTPEVAPILGGKDFTSSIYIIPPLVLGYFFCFLYSFPVNFEFYNKKTIHIATGTFSAAILNIILNIILIRRFSSFGAALATCVSYGVLFIFHHVIAKYIIVTNYYYRFRTYLMPLTVMLTATVLYYHTLEFVLFRWISAIIIGIILIIHLIKTKNVF